MIIGIEPILTRIWADVESQESIQELTNFSVFGFMFPFESCRILPGPRDFFFPPEILVPYVLNHE